MIEKELEIILKEAPNAFFVGGFVRDILQERECRDVDIVLEGDVAAVSRKIASAVSGDWFALDEERGIYRIIVEKGARVRYTTIQNWSTNVYNLVTKRAWVEEEGIMEWVDGNLGSKATMKYPCCILAGRKAHGEMLSLALATKGQHQDTGAKMIHLAPQTSSQIIAKSVAKDGGRCSYRGLVRINPQAEQARSQISCDALILDPQSRSDTYPLNQVETTKAIVEHEATVSQISQEQLFYLTSRGFDENRARALIVAGFIQPLVKQLPLEYAVELNRLIELEMEGAVG